MSFAIQSIPVDPVTPASTALVKTYAAVAGYVHSIGGISWSTAMDPTTGDLIKVVEDAEGTPVEKFRMYITNKGPGFHPFPKALEATRGKSMVITLTNAGTVAATLNIINYVGPFSS